MKYHINPKTKVVGECRAEKRCRFGNITHYPKMDDALKAAEAQLAAAFPAKKLKKAPVKKDEALENKKTRIKELFKKVGVPTDSLQDVSSEDEIVQHWFAGDRKKYDLVSRISDPDGDLNATTKNGLAAMVKRGATVGFISTVEDMGQKASGKSGESSVDLIDDFEDDKNLLSEINSGKLSFR